MDINEDGQVTLEVSATPVLYVYKPGGTKRYPIIIDCLYSICPMRSTLLCRRTMYYLFIGVYVDGGCPGGVTDEVENGRT